MWAKLLAIVLAVGVHMASAQVWTLSDYQDFAQALYEQRDPAVNLLGQQFMAAVEHNPSLNDFIQTHSEYSTASIREYLLGYCHPRGDQRAPSVTEKELCGVLHGVVNRELKAITNPLSRDIVQPILLDFQRRSAEVQGKQGTAIATGMTNNICVLQPDSDACAEFRLFKEADDIQDKTNLNNRLLIFLLRVIPTVGVLLLVIGGYAYIFGDKEKGKSIILYTVVGLLLAYLSYAIVQYILSFLFRNVS
ncbi:TrbC/VirB2 family protein [Candidatus Peribacteria bacterium]|nr:TrbC/VirB2 family protein [Candidatus Peribacteria bacterium]